MVKDHSKTYRLNGIRNIAHVLRLRAILKTLRKKVPQSITTYGDYGCSNGFITSQIAELFGVDRACGYDFSENLHVGANRHPDISFFRLDLNVLNRDVKKFDLVTCFETLEHVGNIAVAIENICLSRNIGGYLFITVPVEIGFVGILKYIVKRFCFFYDLPLQCNDRDYLVALLRHERISEFRLPASGFGTHFGFDYRDVDELLSSQSGIQIEAWNAGTTRFYFIQDA